VDEAAADDDADFLDDDEEPPPLVKARDYEVNKESFEAYGALDLGDESEMDDEEGSGDGAEGEASDEATVTPISKVDAMTAAKAKKKASKASKSASKSASKPPKLRNRDKVGDPQYHPTTSLWSCNHGKKNSDVHAAITTEAWKSWLETKCTAQRGIGRLERGNVKNLLHLQGWYECHCGTDNSSISAMKEAFKDHFGAIPTCEHTTSTNPFTGTQKTHWMTGYVIKTLPQMAEEPGTTLPMTQGDCFTPAYLENCLADYNTNCPVNPHKNKTLFGRTNCMLFAMNFVTKELPHITPQPSFGRTLQLMINSKKYMPSPSMLTTGYPLDRERSEKLWRIQWNPEECTKEEICECIFSNNEAMQQPVLFGSLDKSTAARPPFPCFGEVDLENSPYHTHSYSDLKELNHELGPNAGGFASNDHNDHEADLEANWE
jgi:hypothetical protein